MFFRSWRALFLLASMLLLVGCKARQPGHAETAVMGVIKRRITIRGSERNPVEAKDQEIEAGRKTSRSGWSEYGSAVCKSNVTTSARFEVTTGAELQRRTVTANH